MLVDANLLIYAHVQSTPDHDAARRWFSEILTGVEPIGLPLQSILAFVRLTTNARIFENPMAPAVAIRVVRSWLERPQVSVPAPGDRHWAIFEEACVAGQARGARTTDAHLAALAIEHGASLATADRGFARFPGLKFTNPLPGHGEK